MAVSTKYDVLLGKRLNSMKLSEHFQFCIFALKSVANKIWGRCACIGDKQRMTSYGYNYNKLYLLTLIFRISIFFSHRVWGLVGW